MCLPSEVKGTTIQRIAATVGTILCLNFGMMFGITPAHTRLYQSADTPLNRPIDEQSAVWVSSHIFLSGACGALILGSIAGKIGPKSVLLLSGLLQLTSWFCIHFAFDILHIYASRMFAGFAAGAAFSVLPTFIVEISHHGTTLAAIIDQAQTLGILIGFLLTKYLPYTHVTIVGLGVSTLFSMVFPFVQESPYYYLRKADLSSLEKSLRWFRGIRNLDDRDDPAYTSELATFKTELKLETARAAAAKFSSPKQHLKTSLICIAHVVGAQLSSGFYIILNYSTVILAANGLKDTTSVSADGNILILVAAAACGANLAAYLCSKIKRKLLFIASALLGSLSLMLAALLMSYETEWQLLNVSVFGCLPLVLLSLHLLFANLGPLTLVRIMMGELLPPNMRNLLSSFIYSLSWLVVFLFIHCFAAIETVLSVTGCFWLFAANGIAIAACCFIFVPAERSKSLNGAPDEPVIVKISAITNGHVNGGN